LWLLLSAALWLFSCHRAGVAPVPDEVVVGLEGNPTVLDPRVAQDAYSTRILPLVFEGLVELDKNSGPGPLLAESFTRQGLTYTFKLRKNRRCPDGTEIKASDVVASIKSLADPELRSPRRLLLDKIESITATGDYTVSITLKEPYAPLLTDLAMGIVPEMAAKEDGFAEAPFGSGPYRVVKYKPGERVVLETNPNYAGPRPKIRRVAFRILPDDVTRVMALEKGEVHLLQNSVPPDDMPILSKNPRLKVMVEPGVNYSYIGFNLAEPPLSDLRVRQAIAHAIDREKLAGCLMRGTVIPARSLLSPSHWAYNPDVKDYRHNPDKARELLDNAGYRDPDGPEPRFHLTYKTSQNKTRRWIAEAVADQLRQVGIQVSIRSLEWGAFFGDVRAGNFEMYSLTWVGVNDPDIYYLVFNSKSFPPQGANRNRYKCPEMDRLTEEGRRTLEREERKAIYAEVQKIAARDLPYVSLWHENNVVVMDRRLEGFVIYPSGDYRSLARAKWTPDEGH